MSLFEIKENTYHKAFALNGFVAGVSAALLVEYRNRDPLGLYKEENSTHDMLYNIFITIIIGIATSYIAFWITRHLFGFGDSVISD